MHGSDFERQSALFAKQVTSKEEFQKARLTFNSAKEESEAAENNLELIRKGGHKKFSNYN